MPTCNSYCSTPLPAFTENDCDATVAAGGKTAVLFDCDSVSYVADVYSTANVNTDIASGKATVIPDALVSAPDASPNAAGSTYKAGAEPKTSSYTQTITIMDANVSIVNDAAYESIDATTGRSIASVLVITVGGHTEKFKALNSFNVTITKPIDPSIDEQIHYVATLTGKMLHKSEMIVTPVI